MDGEANTNNISALFSSEGAHIRKFHTMFRAIGVVIILWYLSHQFTQSFVAFDHAGKAVFEAVEAAAVASQQKIE